MFDNPKRDNTRRFVRRLKVLELNIESRGYDFLGMASEIKQYCNKNQISPKLANRIRFVFEELVQQMLLPEMETPHIQAMFEYSEADEQATMNVRYNGEQFNVLECGDEFSCSMLMGNTRDISYEPAAADGFTNCLTLVFDEKQFPPDVPVGLFILCALTTGHYTRKERVACVAAGRSGQISEDINNSFLHIIA